MLLSLVHCGSRPVRTSPEKLYGSIQTLFVAGELRAAGAEADQADAWIAAEYPAWAAAFRLQRARIEIYRGDSRAALLLLEPPVPSTPDYAAISADRLTLLAIAYARTGDLARADAALQEAEGRSKNSLSRSQFHLAEGAVALEGGALLEAQRAFQASLADARRSGDRFQQTQALLNVGVGALRQDHYEDALGYFDEASRMAKEIGARQALEKAEGNAGAVFYKIGDFPHALTNAEAAEQVASELGSTIDRAGLLYDAGMSQYRLGNLQEASASFERSYQVARSIQNNEEIGEALSALASLSLHTGDTDTALKRAREAKAVAERIGNAAAATEPSLLEAEAVARDGDAAGARSELLGLLHARSGAVLRPFVRWQVEGELARLADASGDAETASVWFGRAIDTFRLERDSLEQIETRLPFVENGTALYLDYMESLLRRGKTKDALLVLDRSRAEILAGPAISRSTRTAEADEEWRRDPRVVARRLQGTVLIYCFRPGTSYLWVVAPDTVSFLRLPGKESLLPLLQSHTNSVLAGRDVLSQESSAGSALYQALVAPADNLIAPGTKVFVIADGELSHLNFETLVAPGARRHFWIEDVDVVNARSLSLLAVRSQKATRPTNNRLLLVGNPVYREAEYQKLPFAAEEVAGVAEHFPPSRRAVLTGPAATRSAYTDAHPENFGYIHFVAHATASEVNPLDSAVILSASPNGPEEYKLYARDIINSSVQADLVTISACFGSGVRTYSGEGLVGLAWAFLRAGSRNVVGALWEVSDISTPRLMDDMYRGVAAGEPPDIALRSAKLAMIQRGGVFRKPFYWAVFQLYS